MEVYGQGVLIYGQYVSYGVHVKGAFVQRVSVLGERGKYLISFAHNIQR